MSAITATFRPLHFTYKEGLGIALPKNLSDNNESEFLTNVFRGKLPYPPGYLFDFSLYCYTFFKARSEKKLKSCCNKIFRQAYKFIMKVLLMNLQ